MHLKKQKVTPGFWHNKANQKDFFLKLAKELNIKDPSDWGKVSTKNLQEHGGISILKSVGSIPRALRSIFPETHWEESWFSKFPTHSYGYWRDKINQRHFMDSLAIQFGIKTPEDWGRITLTQVLDHGGGTLLNCYSSSLFKTLKGIYSGFSSSNVFYSSETNWKEEWFTRTHLHFHNKENQKIHLDTIAKKLGIRNAKDWGKVTFAQINEYGGRSVLRFYGNSIIKALHAIYPGASSCSIVHKKGIAWKREWFVNIPKYSPSFWKIEANQRKFMELLASEYNIKNPTDWSRVSNSFIKKKGGKVIYQTYVQVIGKGLLTRFNNSLFLALKSVYPNQNWQAKSNQSSPQIHVYGHVQELFPCN